jgi:CheY-like chemotaxis protein
MRGTGTILVVDDEAMIRTLATLALKRLGYTVLVAENGLEAVTIFEQREADITAILLDIAMPVMNGEEALQRIRKIPRCGGAGYQRNCDGHGNASARRRFIKNHIRFRSWRS